MINTQTTGILMQGGTYLSYEVNSTSAENSGKFFNEGGGLGLELIDYMTMNITSNITNLKIKTPVGGWLDVYSSPPGVITSPNKEIVGSNNFSAYFKADDNNEPYSRFTNIELIGGGFNEILKISQLGSNPMVEIDEDQLTFEYDDYTNEIRYQILITSNENWTLSSIGTEPNWIGFYRTATGGSASPSIGDSGTKRIYVGVLSNNLDLKVSRNRTINVLTTSGLRDECSVRQKPQHYLDIIPPSREYPAEGGEVFAVTIVGSIPNDVITVHNEAEFIVDYLPSTITLSQFGRGVLYLDAKPNPHDYGIVGTIFFTNSIFNLNDGKKHTLIQPPL